MNGFAIPTGKSDTESHDACQSRFRSVKFKSRHYSTSRATTVYKSPRWYDSHARKLCFNGSNTLSNRRSTRSISRISTRQFHPVPSRKVRADDSGKVFRTILPVFHSPAFVTVLGLDQLPSALKAKNAPSMQAHSCPNSALINGNQERSNPLNRPEQLCIPQISDLPLHPRSTFPILSGARLYQIYPVYQAKQ